MSGLWPFIFQQDRQFYKHTGHTIFSDINISPGSVASEGDVWVVVGSVMMMDLLQFPSASSKTF